MFGFRTFDESGNKDIDVSDRLTRYLNLFSTGTSDGSLNVNASILGAIYWFVVLDRYPVNGVFSRPPEVSLSGTTISWTFSGAASGQRYSVDVLYGVR